MPKALDSVTCPQWILVERGRLVARADAVAPVVVVREAAARPAEVGGLDLLQRVDDVVPHAIGVGDRRVDSYVQATVDAPSQVLGEVAVQVPRDHAAVLVAPDGGLNRFALCRATAKQAQSQG